MPLSKLPQPSEVSTQHLVTGWAAQGPEMAVLHGESGRAAETRLPLQHCAQMLGGIVRLAAVFD